MIPAASKARIIPARAGFTAALRRPPNCFRDHPRSRGVYAQGMPVRINIPGSSPLARGLLRPPQAGIVHGRIIPARAGFTAQHRLRPEPDRDHPRSRGVYSWRSGVSTPPIGSSPLARGLRDRPVVTGYEGGIIPARAGFTTLNPSPARARRDHPRSRGVYTCGSLESQRRATLPDRVCLHCRPSARSAELR